MFRQQINGKTVQKYEKTKYLVLFYSVVQENKYAKVEEKKHELEEIDEFSRLFCDLNAESDPSSIDVPKLAYVPSSNSKLILKNVSESHENMHFYEENHKILKKFQENSWGLECLHKLETQMKK